ncbi:hypothetical protein [Nocardioides stalactiti]|uniref:hypothetical protein n=1 Tax=Nocardioides stalactiti TaxID=2755356 RepID=UPI001604876C|nr:hypothetical protein [Nocardioides stalactiti]
MYRMLLIFPASVEAAVVERIAVDEMAPFLRGCDGFGSMSISVGPMMGPAARGDGASVVVTVELDTLDHALAAIGAQEFAATAGAVESLGAEIYLYEARDL